MSSMNIPANLSDFAPLRDFSLSPMTTAEIKREICSVLKLGRSDISVTKVRTGISIKTREAITASVRSYVDHNKKRFGLN